MLNRFKIAVGFISLGVGHLLAPSTTVYAQYVDTVHVTDTQHEFTFCYNWDYNYLTSVSELRDSNTNIYGWGYLQFKQYDENFNVILETRFQDSNYRYFGWRNLSFLNDAYYFGGLKYNLQLGTDSEGYLIKFDTVGNIIWERNYYTNVESSRVLIVEPNDDKLHVVGENYYPSTTNQNEVFLIQTDTSGAPQWTKTFNQAYGQAPISYKVTSDGGGGLATTYILNNTNYRRTSVYKLDANGNTQWQKILGYQAPFQGPTVESIAAVTQMPDGNYLCYGWKDHYSQGTKRSWLVKLSPNGTVLKDTVYDFSSGYDVFSGVGEIIFTETGFYIGGVAYDNINATYSKYYYCYVDNDLNLQWRKPYWKREAENGMLFQKQLDNSFIVMAGFVFPDSPTNTADEWFMVLDSMGCETELCAISMGIYETMYPSNNEYTITLYPNPAQDEVYFAINDNQYNNMHYTLVDISGKVVLQGTTQFRNAIDISNLPNGYYVMQVQVGEQYVSKPLIVNR